MKSAPNHATHDVVDVSFGVLVSWSCRVLSRFEAIPVSLGFSLKKMIASRLVALRNEMMRIS